MAVTGIVLVGFILAHVTANLLIFVGASALNAYAAKLRTMPVLLWGVRALLLVSRRAARGRGRSADARERDRRGRSPYHRARAAGVERCVAHDAVGRCAILALHRLPHPALHDADRRIPDFIHLAPYRQRHDRASGVWWVAAIYVAAWSPWRCISTTARGASFQTLGIEHAAGERRAPARWRRSSPCSCRSASWRFRSRCSPGSFVRCDHGTAREDPVGPAGGEVGPAPLRDEAREPGEQAAPPRFSSSARGWRARRPRRRSPSSATT